MNLLLVALLSLGYLEASGGVGELLPPSAKSVALSEANAGISDSISGFVETPALLPLKGGISLYMDGDIGYYSETHLRWVFDRFDNTIGEEAVYSSASSYVYPGTFAFSFSRDKLGIGLSYLKRIDLSYDYDRTERTDFYTVVKQIKRKIRGGTRELGLSFGYRPFDWISFGLSGLYLSGNKVDSLIENYVDSTSISGVNGDYNGYDGKFSLFLAPIAAVNFGLSYVPKITLEGDFEETYPEQFSVAFSFRPPSKWPTQAFLRFIYTDWHKEGIVPKRTFAIGFSHYVFGGTEFMFGGRFENDSFKEKHWYPVYSFGVGESFRKFIIDLAIDLKPKDYSYEVEGNTERIEESIAHLRAGMGYTF